jgi:glucan phosphoethanolaminetransferase (alkaline phosphatase superfamily)
MRQRNDLAFAILVFVASLLFAGMLYGVFISPVDTLFAVEIDQPSSELAQTQSWFNALWSFLPFIFLVIIALRLVARAAFESRGGV